MTHTWSQAQSHWELKAVKPHQMFKGRVWKGRPALRYTFSISCVIFFLCIRWSSVLVGCCQSRTCLTDCTFPLPGQGKPPLPSAACLTWGQRCSGTYDGRVTAEWRAPLPLWVCGWLCGGMPAFSTGWCMWMCEVPEIWDCNSISRSVLSCGYEIDRANLFEGGGSCRLQHMWGSRCIRSLLKEVVFQKLDIFFS